MKARLTIEGTAEALQDFVSLAVGEGVLVAYEAVDEPTPPPARRRRRRPTGVPFAEGDTVEVLWNVDSDELAGKRGTVVSVEPRGRGYGVIATIAGKRHVLVASRLKKVRAT